MMVLIVIKQIFTCTYSFRPFFHGSGFDPDYLPIRIRKKAPIRIQTKDPDLKHCKKTPVINNAESSFMVLSITSKSLTPQSQAPGSQICCFEIVKGFFLQFKQIISQNFKLGGTKVYRLTKTLILKFKALKQCFGSRSGWIRVFSPIRIRV